MTAPDTPMRTQRSMRRHALAGIAMILLLAGGFGGWAATTDIAGAVIATGSLVVDSNVKKVQHPTGGIVGAINARNGAQVRGGDVLLKLDDTVPKANLAIITHSLDEMQTRKARLQAERDGLEQLSFPASLSDRGADADVHALMENARALFELRLSSRQTQKFQLREQVKQLELQVIGLVGQERAKAKEIELVGTELAGARQLHEKGLMPISKYTALQREATRLEGERGALFAGIGQAKGKIAEIELAIVRVDRDLSSEVGNELRDVEAKIAEYSERKITAEDQIRRIEIRAPQDGTVLQSIAHTVGGVIAPGEQIMLIVPRADQLIVEAKVMPQDIDQLQTGQPTLMRFSAFNQRTTPELWGTVKQISADAVTDPRTSESAYLVRVALDAQEHAKLGELKLVPGMPAEVFFQTGQRKALSYFMKPISDQLSRTFREE